MKHVINLGNIYLMYFWIKNKLGIYISVFYKLNIIVISTLLSFQQRPI